MYVFIFVCKIDFIMIIIMLNPCELRLLNRIILEFVMNRVFDADMV